MSTLKLNSDNRPRRGFNSTEDLAYDIQEIFRQAFKRKLNNAILERPNWMSQQDMYDIIKIGNDAASSAMDEVVGRRLI